MITSSVTMIAAILICFIAAMLNLAVESRVRLRMTRAALVTAALLGAFFYGYGYAWCEGLHVYSLIKALLALCRMFGGANDLGAVQAAPLFRYPVAISVFWLAHYLAFYVTASATVAALGERLLRRIRVMRLRKGPLLLVYGVNPHSVTYARRMARDKGRSVVLVDPDDSSSFESAVKAFGGVLEKDDDALAASPRFLRLLRRHPLFFRQRRRHSCTGSTFSGKTATAIIMMHMPPSRAPQRRFCSPARITRKQAAAAFPPANWTAKKTY